MPFSTGTEPAGFGCSVKRAGPKLGRRSLYTSLLSSAASAGDCGSDGGVATPHEGENQKTTVTDDHDELHRGEVVKFYFDGQGVGRRPAKRWGGLFLRWLRYHLGSLRDFTRGWVSSFGTYATGLPAGTHSPGKRCTVGEDGHCGQSCSQKRSGFRKTLLLGTEAAGDAGATARRFWKRHLAGKRKKALVLLPLCAAGVFLCALTLLRLHAGLDKEGEDVDGTEDAAGAQVLQGIPQEGLLRRGRHSEQTPPQRQPEERVVTLPVTRHLPAAPRATGDTAQVTESGEDFTRILLRRQRQPGKKEGTAGAASGLLSAEMLHQLMIGLAMHQQKLPAVEADMPQAVTPLRTDLVIRDFMNSQYVIELGVGTPQQPLRVIADTGSSDFWACSEKCGVFCMLHKVYAHSKSSTYKPDNSPYNVTYVGGPVSGFLSVDDLTIGDLTARQVLFAEADNVKGLGTAFFFGHFDGVLGMGLPATSSHGLKPLMQTAIEQQLLKKWVFAFYLSSDDSVDGELTLGGYDSARVDGAIVYTPLADQRYWMINTQGLRVKDTVISNTTKVIVDSGTTLIAGPLDEVDRIAHMFGAFSLPMLPKGTYVISCDEALTLEDLVLIIEGSKFTISARDLVIKISDIKGVPCLFGMIGLHILEGKAAAQHKVAAPHHHRGGPSHALAEKKEEWKSRPEQQQLKSRPEQQQLNSRPGQQQQQQQEVGRQGSLLSRLLLAEEEAAAAAALRAAAVAAEDDQALEQPGSTQKLPPASLRSRVHATTPPSRGGANKNIEDIDTREEDRAGASTDVYPGGLAEGSEEERLLTDIGRLWIFGDVFMRGVYTIFDYDEKRIGFAKLKVKTQKMQNSPIRRE